MELESIGDTEESHMQPPSDHPVVGRKLYISHARYLHAEVPELCGHPTASFETTLRQLQIGRDKLWELRMKFENGSRENLIGDVGKGLFRVLQRLRPRTKPV